MEALKARILSEGQNLGKGILKVDSFINHQVDARLMLETGKELAARFAGIGVTKVFTAEMSIRVTNAAIQLMGGNGYSREHPLERMFRDARAFTLAGGSVEMQRLGIASRLLGRSLPQHPTT